MLISKNPVAGIHKRKNVGADEAELLHEKKQAVFFDHVNKSSDVLYGPDNQQINESTKIVLDKIVQWCQDVYVGLLYNSVAYREYEDVETIASLREYLDVLNPMHIKETGIDVSMSSVWTLKCEMLAQMASDLESFVNFRMILSFKHSDIESEESLFDNNLILVKCPVLSKKAIEKDFLLKDSVYWAEENRFIKFYTQELVDAVLDSVRRFVLYKSYVAWNRT